MAQHLAENVGAAPLLLLAVFASPCPPPGAATIGSIGVLCPVKRFAHLPCPGCGITRSVVATAHGQLLSAVMFHPGGPFVFAWILYAAAARLPAVQKRLPKLAPKSGDTLMALGIVILIGI